MSEDQYMKYSRKLQKDGKDTVLGSGRNEKKQQKKETQVYTSNEDRHLDYIKEFIESDKLIWNLRKLENKQDKFDQKNLTIKLSDYIPKKLDLVNLNTIASPKVYATSYDGFAFSSTQRSTRSVPQKDTVKDFGAANIRNVYSIKSSNFASYPQKKEGVQNANMFPGFGQTDFAKTTKVNKSSESKKQMGKSQVAFYKSTEQSPQKDSEMRQTSRDQKKKSGGHKIALPSMNFKNNSSRVPLVTKKNLNSDILFDPSVNHYRGCVEESPYSFIPQNNGIFGSSEKTQDINSILVDKNQQ